MFPLRIKSILWGSARRIRRCFSRRETGEMSLDLHQAQDTVRYMLQHPETIHQHVRFLAMHYGLRYIQERPPQFRRRRSVLAKAWRLALAAVFPSSSHHLSTKQLTTVLVAYQLTRVILRTCHQHLAQFALDLAIWIPAGLFSMYPDIRQQALATMSLFCQYYDPSDMALDSPFLGLLYHLTQASQGLEGDGTHRSRITALQALIRVIAAPWFPTLVSRQERLLLVRAALKHLDDDTIKGLDRHQLQEHHRLPLSLLHNDVDDPETLALNILLNCALTNHPLLILDYAYTVCDYIQNDGQDGWWPPEKRMALVTLLVNALAEDKRYLFMNHLLHRASAACLEDAHQSQGVGMLSVIAALLSDHRMLLGSDKDAMLHHQCQRLVAILHQFSHLIDLDHALVPSYFVLVFQRKWILCIGAIVNRYSSIAYLEATLRSLSRLFQVDGAPVLVSRLAAQVLVWIVKHHSAADLTPNYSDHQTWSSVLHRWMVDQFHVLCHGDLDTRMAFGQAVLLWMQQHGDHHLLTTNDDNQDGQDSCDWLHRLQQVLLASLGSSQQADKTGRLVDLLLVHGMLTVSTYTWLNQAVLCHFPFVLKLQTLCQWDHRRLAQWQRVALASFIVQWLQWVADAMQSSMLVNSYLQQIVRRRQQHSCWCDLAFTDINILLLPQEERERQVKQLAESIGNVPHDDSSADLESILDVDLLWVLDQWIWHSTLFDDTADDYLSTHFLHVGTSLVDEFDPNLFYAFNAQHDSPPPEIK
ncbi:hypothetical protein DM01DRAFT_1411370 [Hesseltinella vesiculosa]|uniref:Uncharacterized protein n=1 Tax=Hesseltinella vesiculosa TaxID=101127 RepID=A0A1X2G422_9FUNG|nr:hypothetical protein DM01DRAFT_1411370 [Hesseltinella vesiculosa]